MTRIMTYGSDLARSLDNLSIRLGELGRDDDAARARREAADIEGPSG